MMMNNDLFSCRSSFYVNTPHIVWWRSRKIKNLEVRKKKQCFQQYMKRVLIDLEL